MAEHEQLWLDGFGKNNDAKKINSSVNKIDEEVLHEVINEMLAEKDSQSVIRDSFLWRVILLYNEKIGVTIKNENEMKEFYEKIRPILLSLLEKKAGTKYKIKLSGESGKILSDITQAKRDITTKKIENFRELINR
ncbi:MAG: hypothetical protein WCL13_03440 [bacterium]